MCAFVAFGVHPFGAQCAYANVPFRLPSERSEDVGRAARCLRTMPCLDLPLVCQNEAKAKNKHRGSADIIRPVVAFQWSVRARARPERLSVDPASRGRRRFGFIFYDAGWLVFTQISHHHITTNIYCPAHGIVASRLDLATARIASQNANPSQPRNA